MPVFAIIWPWIGLGAAVALLVVLFATDGLQADRRASRWFDLQWLVWLAFAAYLLHQFEEHGVDLLGQPYAFRTDLCRILSYRDPIACPVPLSFITAVNVGTVWIAGLVSVLLVRRMPPIGLSFFAIPLVNALTHIGSAVVEWRYNPGLLTACVLFVPLNIWTLWVARARLGAPLRALGLTLAGGIAVHAVLMGSLMAFLRGYLPLWPLNGLQVLNGLVPAALMYLGTRRLMAPPPPPPAPQQPRRRSAPRPKPQRAEVE